MSNENDRPGNTWDDEHEGEFPRTFRDSYLNAANSYRPRPRPGNTSQGDVPRTPRQPGNRARPRGSSPGGGRIYEERDDRPSQRPRPARQSREEVYARLRQRPRRPIYARDQEELPPRQSPPARNQGQLAPRREPLDDYPYQQPDPPRVAQSARRTTSMYPDRSAYERGARYNDYDEYDDYEGVREPARREASRHQHRPRRSRSAFSTLLTGCLGGLITLIVVAAVVIFLVLHNTPLGTSIGIGKSLYTQSGRATFSLGSATQLIVKNQVGDVTVSVDPNASSASLVSVKKVQASGSSDANSQFSQIKLTTRAISQGDDPACTASSCLLIAATVPVSSSGGLLGGGNGDEIDLTITLPSSFHSASPASPYTLSASTEAGNIAVSSLNGILNLTGNAGNISVTHALIYAGTCMQTMHGNVNVDQGSIFDLATASPLIPCTKTTGGGDHPWFNIKSGVGNVDITLTSNSTDLLLDANTNNGTITNDFGLNIPTASDGSATYHGPLVASTNPRASLYVATSTGNIALHKQ